MKIIVSLFVACCSVFLAEAQTYKACHFYVSAHPDDWQLFMGINAYQEVGRDTNKVIFIHVTAGDAGWLASKYGMGNTAYYLAREKGAKNSVEFAVNAKITASTLNVPSSGTTLFNGKAIKWYKYKNTMNYVLRLPDGFSNSSSPNNLGKLYNQIIDTLRAVDNSASYAGWDDLVKTVADIVLFERDTIPIAWINYPDPDPVKNTNDHNDHKYSGLLMQDVIDTTDDDGFNQRLFLNYVTGNKTANLTRDQTKIESGLFAAYCLGLTMARYKTDWITGFTIYCDKNYYSEILHNDSSRTGHSFRIAEPKRGTELYDCIPNPASQMCEVSFNLCERRHVTVTLYDEAGKMVRTLAGGNFEMGMQTVKFDTGTLPVGTYMLLLDDGNSALNNTLEVMR